MAATGPESLERDLQDFSRMESLRSLLGVVCQVSGMGFAAVARVTESRWVALAVQDNIAFGIRAGQELDVQTTLCNEVRARCEPIVIDDATTDARYATHPTPRQYGFKSYIAVPIVLRDGHYFGTLCALDRRPARATQPHVLELFKLLAQLIASQLEGTRRSERAERAIDSERVNSALRETFIAIMAHDLRNPLMGIVGNAEMLKLQVGQQARPQALISKLLHSVERMKLLLLDVEDLVHGRLGGGVPVRLEWVNDLQHALEDVVGELRSANPTRRFDVTISVPHPVRCDRTRMQQLLSNLVSNALVHGAADTPVVVLVGEHGDQLVLCVSNEGTPIAPDMLGSVFGAFVRGENRGEGQGMGLGLYICEQVAKAHGGSIAVTSTSEEGTVFTARLPLAGPLAKVKPHAKAP